MGASGARRVAERFTVRGQVQQLLGWLDAVHSVNAS
jgi:hypothetical protein